MGGYMELIWTLISNFVQIMRLRANMFEKLKTK